MPNLPLIYAHQVYRMYFYSAYGLNIHSAIMLPELIVSEPVKADVKILFGKLDQSPLKNNNKNYCFQSTAEGMYLFWEGVGTFLIRDGKEIIIDAVPDAEEGRIRLFILGAAMGVLLHQRGFLVLHASAVAVNGAAIAFIGDKGWGKSTMAAALHARGHSLISDDVVALDMSNKNQILVLPAFGQLKLWPDAVASLGENPENFPQLVSLFEKRDYRLSQGFLTKTLPLKRIYVLGTNSTVEIQSIPPQEIITHLIRNSYVTRFGNELLQHNASSHLLQLTQLIEQVSIHRLLRPSELSLLPNIAKLLEEHVAGEALKV
jgi:HPr Serine kinase C-terminal domain